MSDVATKKDIEEVLTTMQDFMHQVDARFDEFDKKFSDRFDGLDERFDQLILKLENLAECMDDRSRKRAEYNRKINQLLS